MMMKDRMDEMATGGGFHPGNNDNDFAKMAETQQILLNNETKQLKAYMEEFKEEMMRMQDEKAGSSNTYGGGFSGQGRSGQVQMQQISNVFYNMLNMMGQQKSD